MATEYQIDLREIDDRRKEEEINVFIEELLKLIQASGVINLEDYERDDVRHELFGYAAGLVTKSLAGYNCNVKTSLGQGGFVGTISITGKHIIPSNGKLFKAAVLASDSLEMEANLDGNIKVNLTFFEMLKKVRDGSKN